MIVLVWLVATLVTLFLIKSGFAPSSAVFVVFFATVLFMKGGVVVGATNGTIGWSMLLVVMVLIGLVVRRLGAHPLIPVITVAVAVMLASGPVISLNNNLRSGGSNVEPASSIGSVELNSKPDIFLVVADGYPGVRALEQDHESRRNELTPS